MIDHTGVKVSDYEKSKKFYTMALKPLGYNLIMEVPREHTQGSGVCGFGESGRPDFWVSEGPPNKPPIHVAFKATSRQMVDEFHAAALLVGGRDNGRPGPRPHYHVNYYGAFIFDPDGHNIEAVFRG